MTISDFHSMNLEVIIAKTGDLITLPFSNTTFIEQPLTSNTTLSIHLIL